MKIKSQFAALVIAAALPFPLIAGAAEDHSAHSNMRSEAKAGNSAQDLASGEVKKVDKEAGKITIKHGPLANLDMPGMTMVFRVKDASMLDQVKAGDQIKFMAEKVDGALAVTKLESSK
jgi:Cu/Ag efflux protein CusF